MVMLRAWCAGFTALAISSGAAAAQSLDSLYEAAKKETALAVVGGGPAPPYEKFARELL